AVELGDAARWERLEPADSIPAARREAAGVYDPVADRLLVYGGAFFDEELRERRSDELWQLSLGDTIAWQLLDAGETSYHDHPYDAISSAAVYDPAGQRMFLFGGEGIGSYAWILDLSE